MSEKIILITGATSGIGKVAAHAVAANGWYVVLAGRDTQKSRDTAGQIRAATGNEKVDFMTADLSSLKEVRRLAREFNERYSRLDVLVNNAGAYFASRETSVDGYEKTFALNHLAPFLLTNLLLAALARSPSPRVVTTSSAAHQAGRLNFDDLQSSTRYPGLGWTAYANSKLANVFFTYELARRSNGYKYTANTFHPGFVASGFGRNNHGLIGLGVRLSQLLALSPEKGAETLVYLASSSEVEGITGKYFSSKKETPSSQLSHDGETAQQLWEASEKLTGLK